MSQVRTMNSPPAPGMGVHEAARREKLRRLQALGHDPWGARFDDHQPIGQIRRRENEIVVDPPPAAAEPRPPEQHGPTVRAAGRIVLSRDKGKLIFLDIRDWTGQIQVFVGRNQVGEDNWALAECLDAEPTVEAGLRAYEARRLSPGRQFVAHARRLGCYLRYSFDSEEERARAAYHAAPERVLAETAVLDFMQRSP